MKPIGASLCLACILNGYFGGVSAATAVDAVHKDTIEGAKSVDVVVVGAGYAGLSAARDLVANGLSVAVLEASSRTGGRAFDVNSGFGPLELGGGWLDSRERNMHAWRLIVDELGFETSADAMGYPLRSSVLSSLGKIVTPAPSNPKVQQEIANVAKKWNSISDALSADALHYDNLTLQDWLDANVRVAEAVEILRSDTLNECSAEPRKQSFLSVLNRLRGLVQPLGPFFRIMAGPEAPVKAMALELGDRVHLSTPVVEIGQDEHGVSVIAQPTGSMQEHWHAQRVVFTGTPSTSFRVTWSPPLPEDKMQLFRNMPLGNQNKLVAVYKEPFWRSQGNSGTVNNYGNEGLPFTCVDHSPFNSTVGVIICFSAGDFGARLWTKTSAERKEIILSFLASYLGPKAQSPLAYVDKNWAADSYIGGGATVYWPPGVISRYGGALNSAFGRVTWAGCDTASPTDAHFGWIDQAIHTGRTAAARIAEEAKVAHVASGQMPLSSLIAVPGGIEAGTAAIALLAWGVLRASLAAWRRRTESLREPLLQ